MLILQLNSKKFNIKLLKHKVFQIKNYIYKPIKHLSIEVMLLIIVLKYGIMRVIIIVLCNGEIYEKVYIRLSYSICCM